MKDIAKEFNLSPSIMRGINQGIHYKQENINYPIRKNEKEKLVQYYSGTNNVCAAFCQEELEKIIYLLENTNISMRQIAKDFKVSSTTIQYINSGKRYFNENINYPIRK